MLSECRHHAGLSNPNVVRYHNAWIEVEQDRGLSQKKCATSPLNVSSHCYLEAPSRSKNSRKKRTANSSNCMSRRAAMFRQAQRHLKKDRDDSGRKRSKNRFRSRRSLRTAASQADHARLVEIETTKEVSLCEETPHRMSPMCENSLRTSVGRWTHYVSRALRFCTSKWNCATPRCRST